MEIGGNHRLLRGAAALLIAREWFAAATVLLIAEVTVIATFGRRPAGVVLSNLIQLTLGVLCIIAAWRAAHRSGSLGSYFWRLMTLTFVVWEAGQYVGFCAESLPGMSVLSQVSDPMFVFSTVPLGMVLFLDPDHEPNRFDRLHVLDFIQAILFWTVVYLFFRPLPGAGESVYAAWHRGLVFDSVLTVGFFLRVVLTRSDVVRALFGRMLLFLCLSTAADTYANYPGRNLRTGDWFDLCWGSLLAIPMLIAATWYETEAESPKAGTATRAHNIVVQQLFPLLYPTLILVVSSLALVYTRWAALIILGSFACSSARMLITQRRLQLSETRLTVAKEAAESANVAKSAFLANMSHEIRTPMNAILGMTALAMEATAAEEQQEYLHDVSDSAGSLLALLNDILDFSKIEAGRLELDPVPVSLDQLLEESIRFLRAAASQKGLALSWTAATGVPDRILADPLRLRQVVLNLLGNAIKFTEHGYVQVTVELEEESDHAVLIRFAVRDTGPGIPADKQELIFNAFCQAESSTSRKHGGTGLGLTISARLVDMMAGRIWVESHPGSGSTFYFTGRFLKAAAEPSPPMPRPPSPSLVAQEEQPVTSSRR